MCNMATEFDGKIFCDYYDFGFECGTISCPDPDDDDDYRAEDYDDDDDCGA